MALGQADSFDESLWPIRSLRANPPGRAERGRRSRVFNAALEQFEELLRASRSVGPASSPILLYYSLNQAGRAVLAAHGPNDAWDVHGHGLGVDTRREEIGKTEIKKSGNGLFQSVAAATGSSDLTGTVTLAEVWAGTPGLERAPGLGDNLPPLFRFVEEANEIRSARGSPFPSEEFWDRQSLYPGGARATFSPTAFTSPGFQGKVIFQVSFPDGEAQREFLDGLVDSTGRGYLRVPLGEAKDQPSGIMTVWLVLIALSALARYEPAGWTTALLPSCALAVPIEQGLRTMTRQIPLLVRDALA